MRVPLPVGKDRLTIPYGQYDHGHSFNHGFVDLRANPSLVTTIPEATGWPELVGLLTAVNAPLGSLWSLGCEKKFAACSGSEAALSRRKLVSYVDIAFAEIERNADPANFEELMGAYVAFTEGRPIPPNVLVAPDLTRTFYKMQDVQGWCLTYWVTGYGDEDADARAAWRTAIELFTEFASTL